MVEFLPVASVVPHERHLPTVKVRVPRNSTKLHHGTLSIGEWTVPCVVGRGGLIVASLKREGDGCTPIGVFPLRYGLFNSSRWTPPSSGLSFPLVPMTDEMVWEEDAESPTYNRLTITPGALRTQSASTGYGRSSRSISSCRLVTMTPAWSRIGEARFSFTLPKPTCRELRDASRSGKAICNALFPGSCRA